MNSIKGIKFEFEKNAELEKLLKNYGKAVQLFLNYLKETKKTSLGNVNKIRKNVMKQTGLSGATSVKALCDSIAIYKSYRKKNKSFPKINNLSMKLKLNYNCKLENNKLRITLSRSRYIYLNLKVGKYQDKFLNLYKQGQISLGEITLKSNYCIFSVKKEYTPYPPEGILALDINEQNITGFAIKNNSAEAITWTLKPIYELNCKYFEMSRSLQKKYPNDFGLYKRVYSKWFKNRKNRKDWYLNNILNEIIKYAQINQLMIVEENLKYLKKGVNRRELKLNKFNNRIQAHRKLPRKILGRLNRSMFNQIQFMLKYKSEWENIPHCYVSPQYNSQICPICGEKNNSTEWHRFKCICGLNNNRHVVSCINMLKKNEDERLWLSLDREDMTSILAVNFPVLKT